MAENVPLPRNFKLLEEYDCCIGKKDHASLITGEHQGFINYGLDEAKDDIFLHYWQGMIFGPQGTSSSLCNILLTRRKADWRMCLFVYCVLPGQLSSSPT